MTMNDQQQLAIIVFFTIPPVSSLTAAQYPREASTFCYMHVQQWQQWQWRKQIQVAGSSALRLPVSYKKRAALCGFSQEAHLGGLSLGNSHPAESDLGCERCDVQSPVTLGHLGKILAAQSKLLGGPSSLDGVRFL